MRTLLVSALIVLGTAAPGWSSIILAQYIFASVDPVPASTTHVNVTSSPLTRNGVTPVTTDGIFFTGVDWPVGAFNSKSFYEVTLTPDPSFLIDFSTVTFDYTVGSNPSYTTELRSSLDSFTSSLGSHTDPLGNATYSDSLAALGQQAGAITFRLYGYVDNNFGQSGFAGHSASFFAVSDPVVPAAVPEPSGLWLMVGGGVVALVARRLKK